MKKIIFSLLSFLFFTNMIFAVSSDQTNLPIMGNGKGLYGKNIYGVGKHIIGVSTLNTIVIDSDKLGVNLGSFLGRPKGTAVNASVATDGTITPTVAYQPIDTYTASTATSSVAYVATSNVPIGSLIYIQSTNATRSVTLNENGNMYLGSATRVLDSPYDLIVLLKVNSTTYVESGFYDNN